MLLGVSGGCSIKQKPPCTTHLHCCLNARDEYAGHLLLFRCHHYFVFTTCMQIRRCEHRSVHLCLTSPFVAPAWSVLSLLLTDPYVAPAWSAQSVLDKSLYDPCSSSPACPWAACLGQEAGFKSPCFQITSVAFRHMLHLMV